jgi:hypothetical protein
MPYNVLGLCEGGAIEAQMFNLAPKFNSGAILEFSTKAPLLQSPCYLPFCFLAARFILLTKTKILFVIILTIFP